LGLLVVIVGYNVKQNLASKADCNAYDSAMRVGNGTKAVELAKRIERRGSIGADRADYMLAQAYETTGDYDRAAEYLTRCKESYYADSPGMRYDWARLEYKRGKKREAFDAWIAAAERVISRPLRQGQVVREIWNETGAGTFVDAKDYVKTKLRAKFRGGATMEKSSYRKLAIFATYADFLACMEAEFAALSESEQAERAAAMDFIRSVATDPNVERDLYPLER
jgi:tetratricopeptide (TPR) repeat protein